MKNTLRILLFFSFFQSVTLAQCTDLGIYYWGGQLNGVDTSVIIPTAHGLATNLGVKTIRISLVSNDDAVYKNGGPCLLGMNLTALASRPDFNAIITDPQFSTVIITAYDWTTFADCNTQNFLDSTFYTPTNTTAIESEYTNLANYLKQFSSKKFIIANWEGDNACYCGSAYYTPNCASAPANLVGFKKWMIARAAGINAANASNVKVGIEFCNIHSLENLGKPSVLNNIIPNVYADYYLYSSYESINISANQMRSDIGFIRTKLASFGKDSSALLIGEMGFGATDWGSAQRAADSLQGIINVVKQKQIPYAIIWVLIDTPSNFGMYDATGVITPNGTALVNSLCTTSAIKQNETSSGIFISPNPSQGALQINMNGIKNGSYNLELINSLGQIVFSESCFLTEQEIKKIDLRKIEAGSYFLRMSGKDLLLTQKLIVH